MIETLINDLLHDADRAVMGASFARRLGHMSEADALDAKAHAHYRAALRADPQMTDPAWQEAGNRDAAWLTRHGFSRIPATEEQP